MNAKAIVGLVAAALVVILAAIPILTNTVQFTEITSNDNMSTSFSAYAGEELVVEFGESITVNGEIVSSFYLISSTLGIVQGTGSVTYINDWAGEQHFTVQAGDTMTIDNYRVTGTGNLATLDTTLLRGQAIYTDPDGDLARFVNQFNADEYATLYIVGLNTPAMFIKGQFDDLELYFAGGYANNAFVDYTVTDYGFTYTLDGTVVDVTGFTYTLDGTVKTDADAWMIAPKTYHAPSDGGTTGTVVEIIPLLLVVALLVSAVIVMRRD